MNHLKGKKQFTFYDIQVMFMVSVQKRYLKLGKLRKSFIVDFKYVKQITVNSYTILLYRVFMTFQNVKQKNEILNNAIDFRVKAMYHMGHMTRFLLIFCNNLRSQEK